MFLLNGKPILADASFTHKDINYPSGWIRFSTPEARAEVGITEVPDPVRPDDRFYWVAYNEKTFSYSETPKDLSALKLEWKQAAKRQAAAALAPSDWMVIRSIEDGNPIPADWKKYRADVRAYSSQLETDIDGAKNIDGFIALVTNPNWPIDPDTQARIDAERKSTPRVG